MERINSGDGRGDPWLALRHRNYRLYWSGNVLSHIGDFMQLMAQSWLVIELTNSVFLLGVIGFCQAIPRLLLGVFGGVLVDRLDRRRLLLYTQFLAMLQALVFGTLVATGVIRFWEIVLLVLFLGVVNSLNQTASQSLLNSLVPKEGLLNAIALNASATNLTKFIGPSLAGLLISVIGISGCLFVNALSFLAIIVSLLMMDIPPQPLPAPIGGLWQELDEAYRYLRGEDTLWVPILVSYVVAIFASPYQRFLPVFARDILGIGVTGYGFLMAAPGVGAMLAAFALATLARTPSPRYVRLLMMGSALSFAGFLTLFAVSRWIPFSFVCLFLVGGMEMAFRTVLRATIQGQTPFNLLGRVMSLYLLDRGLWSLGTLLIGAMAAVLGTPLGLGLAALMSGVASVLIPGARGGFWLRVPPSGPGRVVGRPARPR